jgi:hypothetical protein
LQFAQAIAQTKNCIRVCYATAEKIIFKNSPTLKKIKIHRHTAQQIQQTMTQNLNIYKGYRDTKEGRPAGNSTYKKLAVKWLNEVQFFN